MSRLRRQTREPTLDARPLKEPLPLGLCPNTDKTGRPDGFCWYCQERQRQMMMVDAKPEPEKG